MTRLTSCIALLALAAAARAGDATVTLNPKVKHQTIRGWSCNPHYLGGGAEQREQVLDDAVNMLGLTRMRWQQPNGNRSHVRRWELENDNGDPDVADLSKLNTAYADKFVAAYVLPFKRRVAANGEPFELWLSPSFFRGGSTGDVPAFLLHSPGEYAEYATSFIEYLRKKHGVETAHYAICNEAGNGNAFAPPVVAEMTKVLGARMQALGLPTRGQFSDGVNAGVTWRYIQAAKDDAEVWKHVDVLSYHWYGGKNQESMAKIRDFARQRGMATAQSEFMHLKIDHLYDDLTIGGVSYWSIYGLGGPGPRGQNYHFRLDNTSFRRGRQFWTLRQVIRYVRPGAVRIEATSDDAALRVLAFDQRGRMTVVLINTTPPHEPRNVTVRGLPKGNYGVCASTGGKPYRELGVKAADPKDGLPVAVPPNAVLTIYPHPGVNMRPIVTAWEAKPTFLKTPASRITLSAAAQDPERNPLSYSWTVKSQPKGGRVAINDPEAAVTSVNGLTVPGRYAFEVTVGDGTSAVKRAVLVNVFGGNQPPMLLDVHNRIPVLVTLPHDHTLLIGGALDLEGDKLSFRWSVAKQPQGADVRLETPDKQKCKLTNITVAGDHVVRFEVRCGPHTVAEELTVPVYPANAAPVIEAIEAKPASLTLPDSTTSLSATTRDPDGDVLSHWWRVTSKPPGARPVLAPQGCRGTKVSGLTVEGRYVFTLTVVDRTKLARKAVTVTVSPKAGAAAPAGEMTEPPATWTKSDRVTARGTVTGVVTRKGRGWVEIRAPSGRTARYIPRWIGGHPRDGGGPEKAIVAKIGQLRVGQRVSMRWQIDHHLRANDIQPLP